MGREQVSITVLYSITVHSTRDLIGQSSFQAYVLSGYKLAQR